MDWKLILISPKLSLFSHQDNLSTTPASRSFGWKRLRWTRREKSLLENPPIRWGRRELHHVAAEGRLLIEIRMRKVVLGADSRLISHP